MCNQLLSVRQVWQIREPFVFTEDEKKFLKEHPIGNGFEWKDSIFKPIKDRIREYYSSLQNCTCAYCRLPMHSGTDNIEIEHIVDKNRRSDFTFEPLNLVVSCHNCNFTKSTKKVFHNCPPENEFPNTGEPFKIIHGHFDSYFENIELKQGSFYHAKTDKGDFTIRTCGLSRQGLAEQREEVQKYQDDPIIAKVIEVRNSGNQQELLDSILLLLNKTKSE